jgi:hypothetical protein
MLGKLKLIQIEDLIAERILIATLPQPNEERRKVAKLLLGVVLKGLVECDRAELERVANSPAYDIGEELRQLIDEFDDEPENASETN